MNPKVEVICVARMSMKRRARLAWAALRGKAAGVPVVANVARYGSGYSVTWSDDASEQVKHFSHWVYVAVSRIGDAVAERGTRDTA